MNAFQQLWENYPAALTGWAFSFAFMTAIELLLPRGRQPIAARAWGLFFWTLWIPVTGVVYAAFRTGWAWIGVPPLIVLPLDFGWAGWLGLILAPIAGAMLADFFFYWFHRAQHRFLWRFHAVHHSIRDLSAVNAYHHLSESIFQSLLYMIPASLILGDTGAYAAPAMVVLIRMQAAFIHSPTRLHFGSLAAFFVDNRFHRIHHSLEERHFDRNFGAFTTLWDQLFGTAHRPQEAEWPDVGLADMAQPANVAEWLTLPWRFRESPIDSAPQSTPAWQQHVPAD
ncbi:sterol desaturase family protein [Sphingomonas sp.]|uniref:sterol desaturase family protein n=1 Tax=Sphingomonas sp. TaxID=28214 RepID=UPI001B03F5A9|nr:sterol desaturase family protein [Sphingomonas sp.]MBO9713353.1 sterol desaturase family protein [Sphingomonas sp.]